jgi:hypothetical protein
LETLERNSNNTRVENRGDNSSEVNSHVKITISGAEMPIENVELVIESQVNQHTKMTLTGFLSSKDYDILRIIKVNTCNQGEK